jgi:hypothetical protein|tara:strand:- start:556 stop:789 length:234 start_codon:yes stop_codon:yes gene_type:complete
MSECLEKFKDILNKYFNCVLFNDNNDKYSALNNDCDLSKYLIPDENEYKLFSLEDENNLKDKMFNNNIENSVTQSCP